MENMYSRWDSIENSTFQLSNYYYRDQFGNPEAIKLDLEGDLESDPEMNDEDPDEKLREDLKKLFE